MPLEIAQRIHAVINGMFRKSDKEETKEAFNSLISNYKTEGLNPKTATKQVARLAIQRAFAALGLERGHPIREKLIELAYELLADEDHFNVPQVDWTEPRSVTEWWLLRDEINAKRPLLKNFDKTLDLIVDLLVFIARPILEGYPSGVEAAHTLGSITVETDLLNAHTSLPEALEHCVHIAVDDDLIDADLFPRLRDRLTRNLIEASGGNPNEPAGFTRQAKWPTKSDETDPTKLRDLYLSGTVLKPLFDQTIQFTIPQSTRFEHHHIIAGSGHGKTQTLQYLIANDLDAVAQGKQSIVVIDSQGDLIRNISKLKEFAPDGPLHDRVVIIDPTDVEYPVSLNLFDVGLERIKGYPLLERERLTNSILELYDFVLGSLLSAEMTQKQNVIFRYVTRLMIHIPDATIHTLRELMEPDSHKVFAEDIAKLEGTAKHFFETEFAGREFEQTKKQVLRRLWGILENQTFERMFSHPRSKLDLFSELNAGKVILINTAKDLLKEQGSQIFGRFFIALIAQAAQERATLTEKNRIPTCVYVDEAADYFDRNISLILAQARKYKVGVILAHQYLGQLDPKLQEAFAANTSIKFAGGVSSKDIRTLAPMLYTDASLIERQPKGCFASYARGITKGALPLKFPLGFLEGKERMNPEEQEALRSIMRRRYAVHYSRLGTDKDEKEQSGEVADMDADQTVEAANRDQAEHDPKRRAEQHPKSSKYTDATDTW